MNSRLHDIVLKQKVDELRAKGIRVFETDRVRPDAIAIIKGKITAIDVKTKNDKNQNLKQLEAKYTEYDDLIIVKAEETNQPLEERRIVDGRLVPLKRRGEQDLHVQPNIVDPPTLSSVPP